VTIHELIYNINHHNLDELLPITKIQSSKDVIFYSKKDYATHPIELFKKTFPDLKTDIIDCLYYEPNTVGSILYFNSEKIQLFETSIYTTKAGYELIALNNESSSEIIESKISMIEQSHKKNDFSSSFYMAPDSYKIELLCKSLSKIPQNLIYKLFLDLYTTIDFGSQNINSTAFFQIFSTKTDSQKENTIKKLNKLTDSSVIKVYRGIGDKSNTNGFSYTLNPDIARFFAFRHSSRASSVNILSADVKKEDIIEYIEVGDEEELIVLPDKLFNITQKTYLSIEYFLTKYDKVMNIYKKQKVRFEDFIIDANISYNSNDHNEQHMLRVLILSILLAEHYKLKKSLKPTLYNAAMFHDIGRTNDFEDIEHGANSYKLLCKEQSNLKNDKLLENLITYHCKPDSEAFTFASSDEKLMYQILKDADALDRQRFDIKDLNTKYLRLDFSFEILFAAFQLTEAKV